MNRKNAQVLGFSFQIVVTVIISVIIGLLMDKQFSTAPLFIIIFTVLSIFWMFYQVYNMWKRFYD